MIVSLCIPNSSRDPYRLGLPAAGCARASGLPSDLKLNFRFCESQKSQSSAEMQIGI